MRVPRIGRAGVWRSQGFILPNVNRPLSTIHFPPSTLHSDLIDHIDRIDWLSSVFPSSADVRGVAHAVAMVGP